MNVFKKLVADDDFRRTNLFITFFAFVVPAKMIFVLETIQVKNSFIYYGIYLGIAIPYCLLMTIKKRMYIHITFLFGYLIVVIILFYTYVYTSYGIISSNGVMTKDENTCAYFSVVTFTTLGYGDYAPSEKAKIYAASEALIGYLLLGFFVSLLIIFLQRYFDRKDRTVDLVATLNNNDIPPPYVILENDDKI